MSAQGSRRRPHREAALKAVRGARCALCHRPALEGADTYLIDRDRRRRVCARCFEGA